MFLGNLPWRWSCDGGDHEYRKQLQRHESVGRTSDSAEQRAPFPLNSFSTSSYVDRMILTLEGEGNPRRRFQTWSDWEGNRVFVVRVSITLGKGSPPSNTSRNSVWWMISCIVIFLPKMNKNKLVVVGAKVYWTYRVSSRQLGGPDDAVFGFHCSVTFL